MGGRELQCRLSQAAAILKEPVESRGQEFRTACFQRLALNYLDEPEDRPLDHASRSERHLRVEERGFLLQLLGIALGADAFVVDEFEPDAFSVADD